MDMDGPCSEGASCSKGKDSELLEKPLEAPCSSNFAVSSSPLLLADQAGHLEVARAWVYTIVYSGRERPWGSCSSVD